MRAWLWVVPVAVILVLAGLNLQWVSSLRGGDAARMRLIARQRAEGLAQEFNSELGRAYDLFNTEPSTMRGERWDDFASEYESWNAKASQPHLFRGWYVMHDDGREGLVLRWFDPQRRAFPEVPWSEELGPIRAAVQHEFVLRQQRKGPSTYPHVPPEVDSPPALLIPMFPSAAAVRAGYGPAYGYVVGLLDVEYLRSTFFPYLARKYFGESSGLEYDIDVVDAADPSATLFASGGAHGPPDVQVRLFTIAFAHLDEVFLADSGNADHEGIWLLRATHRDGSIEAHVAKGRRRDVVLSVGVVGLLLASLVLLFVSARRARQLAAQQTAFVAGVSHELRTPLAVIRSAGENLADGMVAEPERVRLYGALVANEGRRLSVLVEQAIRFAALETVAQPAPQLVYDIAPLVEEVAAQSPPAVTREVAMPLPAVRGDPNATRQVLCSLLENAHKHAPESPVTIRVDAIDWRGKRCVRLEIADQGEGVDSTDLPHLFEPFYRGRRAQRGQIPGSGLGLSIVKRLVEQQKGAITVRSTPGKGCTFTVCLPGA